MKMGHEYEFYVVDAATRKPIYGGQPIFATARIISFRLWTV